MQTQDDYWLSGVRPSRTLGHTHMPIFSPFLSAWLTWVTHQGSMLLLPASFIFLEPPGHKGQVQAPIV